ncbi:MAG: phage/plasmid primase, P4 family [Gemella sp.]|nr:phage/plasmid primase, P4 family [Gemella sp.]
MAIYKQQGYKGRILTKVNSDKPLFEMIKEHDLEIIEDDIVIDETRLKKEYKAKEAIYIIVGEINPNDKGQYIRDDVNIISRDYAFLDYDEIDISNADFINLVADKLQGYEYLLYPSVRHTEAEPRYRLVLPLERSANKAEYKHTVLNVADKIGLTKTTILKNGKEKIELAHDKSSEKIGQLQGLPAIRKSLADNYKIIHITGEKFPVSEAKVTERRKNIERTANNLNSNDLRTMFELYLELDEPNLIDDYNNALSVIQTIVKEEIAGTIDVVTASDFVTLLAYDNEAYIKGNIDKYNAEKQQAVVNPNYIRTTYTFKDRFRACISEAEKGKKRKELAQLWNKNYTNPVTDFTGYKNYFDVLENNPDINIIEMFQEIGDNWREENTKINEKTGEVIPAPPMGFTIISGYIKRHIPLILLGETQDISNIYYYDFKDGIYKHSELEIHRWINALEYRYKPSKYKEVTSKLKTEIEYVEETPEYLEKYIPVNNGLFNLKTRVLEPFSYKHYITAKIVTDYTPSAVNPVDYFDVDSFFQTLAVEKNDVTLLIWQLINEAINPNYTRRKMGIILGEGKNGKSTFQDLLINLIGRKNVSTLKLDQITGNKFMVSKLAGKVCNIGDDISDLYLQDVDIIKSITSGQTITADVKNKESQAITVKLFLLFSANRIPKINDKSKALLDRLLIIPFNADFHGMKEDKSIKDEKIRDKRVLEYVLYTALNLPEFEHFIETEEVRRAVDDYKESNDSLYSFLVEAYIPRKLHTARRVPTKVLNALYKNYCESINVPPRANIGKEFFTLLKDYVKENDLPFRYDYQNQKKVNEYYNELEELIKGTSKYVEFNYGLDEHYPTYTCPMIVRVD